MSQLENYKTIITDDGSQTYFSEVYGEACHSTSGAIAETNIHYIEGCKIKEIGHETVKVLEVGFGVGIGFLETLKALERYLDFVSFEIDEKLIVHILEKNNLAYEKTDYGFLSEGRNYKLRVLVGDARDSIKKIDEKFHAIYQDAFSPKRNAILWTQEWFEDLLKLAHSDCIMSTYSASSSIRKSMIAAGWKVFKGVKFGPKRSSTRARLSGDTDHDIEEQLKRSPAPLLTDSNYKDYK